MKPFEDRSIAIITIGDDGVPGDVNLYDVLGYIGDCLADCVRRGEVATVQISDEVLRQAFHNTVKLLKNEVDDSWDYHGPDYMPGEMEAQEEP